MILDADVLIDLYRLRPAAQAWLGSLPNIPLVAGLAAMELVEGAANRHEMRDVRRFLLPFSLPVIPLVSLRALLVSSQ